MAKLLAEEPDALMHARPDLWEPWRATAKATRPSARNALVRNAVSVVRVIAGKSAFVSCHRSDCSVGKRFGDAPPVSRNALR